MSLISRESFFDSLLDDSFYEPVLKKSNVLKCDIYELDNNYIIDMEAPGINKENINIEYEDNYLTISVVQRKEINENKNYIRKERYYGEYKRSFYVGEISEKDIKAKFKDGLLKISFPKTTEKETEKKQIEIE